MPTFKVEVSKDYTTFSAAHFVSYDGDQIEPLHGHNYRTAASIEGDLDANSYVVNFTLLKQAMRAVCDSVDHVLLLPTGNPLLNIRRERRRLPGGWRWKALRVPGDGCGAAADPQHHGRAAGSVDVGRSRGQAARGRGVLRMGLTALTIEVDESFGQRAIYRRDLEWP